MSCRLLAISLVDKYRVLPVVILFVLAVPVVACIGFVGVLSKPMLIALVFLAGFVCSPSRFRWQRCRRWLTDLASRVRGRLGLRIGRAGSIVGPLLGGALISAQLTAQQLYLAGAASAFALGAILSLILWECTAVGWSTWNAGMIDPA